MSPIDAPAMSRRPYQEHSNLVPDGKWILCCRFANPSDLSHDIRPASLGPAADPRACDCRTAGHSAWRIPALGSKGNPQPPDAGIYLGRVDGDRRVSGFFIHGLRLVGPFSPIHLLSAITLVSLWHAIRAARRGDIRRHRKTMVALFWMALILTGFFTFWPGRVMHQVVTGA